MVNNSDFFYFSEFQNSDCLAVIFSGAGAKSFNCFKLLKDYPINILFVRDQGRSWYNGKVDQHWKNTDEMLEKIKSITSKFDSKKVTCIGGSMGGFAALIVASKLKLGKVLAFSPQTKLDYRLPNNPAEKIQLNYDNVFPLLAESTETEVKIYLGTEDFADMYNVYPFIRFNNVDVTFFYQAPHNVMHFLFKRDKLFEIITASFEGRKPQVLLPEFDLLNNLDIYCDLNNFVKGFYLGDESKIDQLNYHLNKIEKIIPDWAGLHHSRGKLLAKIGKHKEAIVSFEKAIEINSKDDSIYKDFGLSAIQSKNYDKAEFAFIKANEFSEAPSPYYLSKLGASYMLQKQYDKAIEYQNNALELAPNFVMANYQLGLVMNILGRYEEAIPYFESAIKHGDTNPQTQKHLKTAKEQVKADDALES